MGPIHQKAPRYPAGLQARHASQFHAWLRLLILSPGMSFSSYPLQQLLQKKMSCFLPPDPKTLMFVEIPNCIPTMLSSSACALHARACVCTCLCVQWYICFAGSLLTLHNLLLSLLSSLGFSIEPLHTSTVLTDKIIMLRKCSILNLKIGSHYGKKDKWMIRQANKGYVNLYNHETSM